MATIHDSIIISTNPATLEVVGEVETTPPCDVEEMVQHAREKFPVWRDLGLKRRSDIIGNAQKQLLDKSDDFARLITLEMGRPYAEALALELEASIDLMGYYAARAGFSLLKEQSKKTARSAPGSKKFFPVPRLQSQTKR